VLRPLDKNSPNGLPLSVKTLPQYFKQAGYQTFISGKWHLGAATRAYLPLARGFDKAYGHMLGGVGYWDHVHGGGLDWHRQEKSLREEGYSVDLIADEAVRQIEARDKDKPMFLYATFTAPHLPNEAPDGLIAKYADVKNPYRRVHAAMVDKLDQGIGQIMSSLKQQDMLDNTIVWFMSDNGGLLPAAAAPEIGEAFQTLTDLFGKPLPIKTLEFFRLNIQEGGSNNGPYRRGKSSIYEGGVLVPSVISWPGTLSKRTIKSRVTVQDIEPTLAQATGIELPADILLDGKSQWSTMQTDVPEETSDYIITGNEGEAYYQDNWKLLYFGENKYELYNLGTDPFEENNVASAHPARVTQMVKKVINFPRGGVSGSPLWKVFFDIGSFGGVEDREPWADIVKD
jgi:arylsulfatase A-like enzyme